MGRAKVSMLTAKENMDPLLSGAGDKAHRKARQSLPLLLWGVFFSGKV